MHKKIAARLLGVLLGTGLAAAAASAKADCAVWSDWASDTKCDGSVAHAEVTNFAGDQYLVQCGLYGSCNTLGTGSSSTIWYAGPECGLRGVRVEFSFLKMNGDTHEYQTESFGYNGDELEQVGCFNSHTSQDISRPWDYVAALCRVGFNCDE